ncbi:response regulator transcription factor [Ligilactobacillus agilis]|uniref:Response regulator n=2 Tax=Ligilactobacillus agilis TaxID=1601 RepID=A0A0R2AGP8_9LACO|nr:response regulator transcription factor [Ligilactobacillus agilis]KRM66488.1 response regulator [Ligilactobacillus agilis DSM 20509]MBL1055115.1 response regulator transcription factor [Ligilactobacillus agilis]MCI5762186.1 response regulator transcription factor [Ligilactobacillus agilis]MCL8204738.1 response regulator transcription factor [Ligilactobacillus agilis]MDK6810476.1 response regulator transcription factor [Ligilactobacillus agilis]
MKKILIIEDEEAIAMIEQDYLELSNFETEVVGDGASALQKLNDNSYDLILLDLMLPGGMSGYDVCKKIRGQVDIPIIMVTAKTESLDKVLGLELGADDYLTKPFDPAELVARVKANLNQYERLKGQTAQAEEKLVIGNGIVMELGSYKVTKDGKELRFPNKEFELLRFLAQNPNYVYSKEQLFEKIWGYDYIGDPATVAVHINRIREKIEQDSNNPKLIETVWGVGYRFNGGK